MGDLSVVFVMVWLIVHLAICFFFSDVAQMKGHSGGAFWICFFLGIGGWLYVIALPDLKQRENQEKIIALLGGKKLESVDGESTQTNNQVTYNDELPPL